MLKAKKQAQQFQLDVIILSSHTSHALQPLYVTCSKPFKLLSRKEQYCHDYKQYSL
jgi:hypothetical protein